MEIALFAITILCIIVIAFTLFGLELIATLNFDTFVAVVAFSFIINWTFLFYYLSEKMTTDLLKIANYFYDSPWYRVLLAKDRISLTLAIQLAQHEVRLRGLGLFDGSLSVFASVFLFSSQLETLGKFSKIFFY